MEDKIPSGQEARSLARLTVAADSREARQRGNMQRRARRWRLVHCRIRRIEPLPVSAILEFLPSGGMLRLRTIDEHCVFLAERRCDLIAALLQPPSGIGRNDFVPDDLLIPRVWGADGAGRTQLNTLIHRVRKTLTRGGLDGPALLERSPGGGGTRFVLAPAAQVEVR
jgi:hypothetical protein